MSKLPEYNEGLLRKIRQRDRLAQRQADATPYARSGTAVTAENEITVNGRFIVNGPLDVNGVSVLGGDTAITGTTHIAGTLDVDASTTIGGSLDVTGPLTIGGSLTLPAGIIGGAALDEQIGAGGDRQWTEGISLTTGHTVKGSLSLPVPPWATSGLVIATGTMQAIGPNLRAMKLSVEIDIDSSPIVYCPQAIEGASTGPYAGTITHTYLVTSLLSTVTVSLMGSSEYGVLGMPSGTAPQNFAYLTATVLWVR